nr:MAG TPA: hypothetical protein [Caudoviricetes sp.]
MFPCLLQCTLSYFLPSCVFFLFLTCIYNSKYKAQKQVVKSYKYKAQKYV